MNFHSTHNETTTWFECVAIYVNLNIFLFPSYFLTYIGLWIWSNCDCSLSTVSQERPACGNNHRPTDYLNLSDNGQTVWPKAIRSISQRNSTKRSTSGFRGSTYMSLWVDTHRQCVAPKAKTQPTWMRKETEENDSICCAAVTYNAIPPGTSHNSPSSTNDKRKLFYELSDFFSVF